MIGQYKFYHWSIKIYTGLSLGIISFNYYLLIFPYDGSILIMYAHVTYSTLNNTFPVDLFNDIDSLSFFAHSLPSIVGELKQISTLHGCN